MTPGGVRTAAISYQHIYMTLMFAPFMTTGGLRTAGRGRRQELEHQGVQPSPLLLEAFQRLPEWRSLRYSWKYEILDVYKLMKQRGMQNSYSKEPKSNLG